MMNMKKMLKYMAVALASISLLAACEEKVTKGNDIPSLTLPETITLDIPDEVMTYIYTDAETSAMTLPMVKGTEATIGYTVTPDVSEIDFAEMQWTSSDEDVASVIDGTITAKAAGTAVITVMPVAPSNKNATLGVVVVEDAVAATGIVITDDATFTKDELPAVYIGETMQLTATITPSNATFKGVKWTSGDEAKATVDMVTGVVTGLSTGMVTITATALDATEPVTETHDIYVDEIITPVGIRINNADKAAKLALNQRSFTLEFETYPASSTRSQIEWKSSDPSVATVEGGVVTMLGNGTVTITATCPDGTETPPAGFEKVVQIPANILEGYLYDHFENPNSKWWVFKTAGTTLTRKYNETTEEYYMEIVPAKSNANTLRADNGVDVAQGKVIVNTSKFPILAFRMEDVNDKYGYSRNINMDISTFENGPTSGGTRYNGWLGGSNNKWKAKYKCSDGSAIILWDLSVDNIQNPAPSAPLPSTRAWDFGLFQIKYADIRKPGQANFEAGETGAFNFYWIETFESREALTNYLDQWSTDTGITYELFEELRAE